MKPWFAFPVALLAACASGPAGKEGTVVKPAVAPAPLARGADEGSSTANASTDEPKPLAHAFAPGEREDSTGTGYYSRKGEYGGLTYSILFDSNREFLSGSIDGPQSAPGFAFDDPDRWVVATKVDEMTDERHWRIVHYRSSLTFFMDAPGQPTSVCLSRADFPGRAFAVRVGKQDMISFNEEECASGPAMRGLFAQMMTGGDLITRGYEWPYDYPKDEKGDASPFRYAHDLFEHMYELVHSNVRI